MASGKRFTSTFSLKNHQDIVNFKLETDDELSDLGMGIILNLKIGTIHL